MGHELDSDLSPIEAGLAAMTRKNGGFIGAEALARRAADGASPSVVSIVLDDQDAVPLGHEPIYTDGRIVGQTTSCAYGYRVGAPIALGHVTDNVMSGARVQVDIARSLFDGTVTRGPLFDPEGGRMRP